ncbi:Na+/H+ antiporter subunit D [Clavibacter michiganensis subsp. michiganensis]|nr:Na+/H+ antiporter subunit D [Clavibacter michiganensis subsp. michiganensis]
MSVSVTLIVIMAALYATGIYLMLERSMTRVLLGFLLVGNATNILILIMSGRVGLAPIYDPEVDPSEYADPLPQALILTAIVITFGVSAFLMALIYRSWRLANADVVTDDEDDLAMRGPRTGLGEEPTVPDDDDTEFGTNAEAAIASARKLRDNRSDLEEAIDDSADDDDDRDFRTQRAERERGGRPMTIFQTLIPLVVLVPLLGAAAALVAARQRRLQVAVSVLALLAVVVISGVLLVLVDQQGGQSVEVGGWAAPFGIVLVVDRLSALMLLISSIVLLAVLMFSIGQGLEDGDGETPVSIYNPTYLILAAGVFNAFVAGDLFNLYVGFEILLVASYVLLTLGGTEARIRAGVTYIVVSLVSSMLFLASIAMIYGALGTVNIAQISVRLDEIPPDVQLILHIMLLVAFGIKAAVFPLSFWLPDSYPTAPAPVTAVFAGLLTKVGVYAILRTETVMFPTDQLSTALMVVAALTMVIGILGAVAQADIKRLLSFTLVSHIGYMIFGIALNTVAGMTATIYYVIHHIVVQTTLFLASGLIERTGGSTSINKLGGLLKAAPVMAILFFIPALNLGGIPPFSGFIGKVALFDSGAEVGGWLTYAVIAAGAATSLLTLYALARVWNMAFWRGAEEVEDYESPLLDQLSERPGGEATTTVRKTPVLMTGATAGMVVVSVALTVFAGPVYALAERAGESLTGPGSGNGSGELGYVETVFPGGIR